MGMMKGTVVRVDEDTSEVVIDFGQHGQNIYGVMPESLDVWRSFMSEGTLVSFQTDGYGRTTRAELLDENNQERVER